MIYLVIYGVYIALRPPGRAIHSFFNLLLPFTFPVQHFAAEIMPIGELDIADELGLIHHSLFNLQLGLIGTGKAGRFHADGYGGTGGDLLAIPAEEGDRRARSEAAFFFLFHQLAVIVINLIAQIHPAGDLGFAQVIEQNIKVVR